MLLVGCVKNDPVTPDWQGPEAEIAFECPIVGAKAKSVSEIKLAPVVEEDWTDVNSTIEETL